MKHKSLYTSALSCLALLLVACQPVEPPPEKVDNKIDFQTDTLRYQLAHSITGTCSGYDYSQELDEIDNIIIGFENGFYYVDWSRVEQVDGCTDNTDGDCFEPSDMRRMNISEAAAKHIEKMINEMPNYGNDSSCSATTCASEVLTVPNKQMIFKQTVGCAEGGADYAEKFSDLITYLKEVVPDL